MADNFAHELFMRGALGSGGGAFMGPGMAHSNGTLPETPALLKGSIGSGFEGSRQTINPPIFTTASKIFAAAQYLQSIDPSTLFSNLMGPPQIVPVLSKGGKIGGLVGWRQ